MSHNFPPQFTISTSAQIVQLLGAENLQEMCENRH